MLGLWIKRDTQGGFVLLAVIAFIAILLPIVIVILSIVASETHSVGETIKGSKAETAVDMAIAGAISLIIQEKQLPNFWVSVTQPNNAIIVDDGFGNRRNDIANNGAGLDGIYGTEDDYWIGPRKDRSFLPGDDPDDPRNYNYDFRYLNNHGPAYLAQRWAFSLERNPFFFVRTPQAAPGFIPIELYNQFAAVRSDDDDDGVPEGFIPDELDMLLTPGYYPTAMPRNGPYNIDLTSPTIFRDMLNYRVQPYYGITENLEEGPLPSKFTRSYASITDENGRLNLNIFVKKLRVWAPEDSSYDSSALDGRATSDFNGNQIPNESGWHWIDNPLFPDRDTTLKADGTPIDFGRLSNSPNPALRFPIDGQDDIAIAELGETVQHLYSEDWYLSAKKSLSMLEALPGIDREIAENILQTLNPVFPSDVQTNWPPTSNNERPDVPNLTPALIAIDVTTGLGGEITDVAWDYSRTQEDDLPLPQPKPFNDVKELLNVPGVTVTKYERLKDFVTVFSYDTNVIQNYISDVSSTVDPINPPDLPPGSTRREIPEYLIDRDSVPDLRYDLNKPLQDTSLSALREEADILYKHIFNHLPLPNFQKISLPVIDRAGRGPSDHLQSGFRSPWNNSCPYNVAETGHEYPLEDGRDYAALDPPFSRDSALSILLYRHGLRQETAYHGYGEPGREVRPGIPVPGTRSFIPIVEPIIIPGFLSLYFQPSFIPDLETTQEYAEIPPHTFSSVADLLEVPLYKFSQFSVDIMADPPSAALCRTRGNDEVTVRYYLTLSDVLKAGEYNDNGTPSDPTDDSLAFTYEIAWDYNNDGVPEAEIPLALNDTLRLIGPPPTPERPAVLTTFDQATGQRYITFDWTFQVQDVPKKDKTLAGTSSGDFAYDAFGNPFIIGRALGVKARGTSEETQADAIVRVYLQENCTIPPPLKVSILAVRQSEDTFMLMSSVAGGVEDPNPLRIYDWDIDGTPTDINGTYPPQPNGRDPRTAVVSLNSPIVRLTVYDMYAEGLPPGIRMHPPDKVIPPGIWTAMWLPNGRLNPVFGANWDLLPESKDTDVGEVELVGTIPQVRAEVAVEPPSIGRGDNVVVHVGAYGGRSPYDIDVQITGVTSGTVLSYTANDYESNTLTFEIGPFTVEDDYNVALTVTDSTTPIPTVDVDTTSLIVGTAGSRGQRFTNVPQMVASINLEELDLPNKGFRATMSVSGGRGGLGYYWQVFDENGQIARDIEGREMVSNEPAPVFQFDPSAASDGVYMVKGMVIDQADVNPYVASNVTMATDSAMVVIASSGSDFENEPMAILSATPPGNDASALDTTPQPPPAVYGAGPEPIITTEAGIPGVSPEIAGVGSSIEIRGYNFNSNPANNIVHFGGGVSAEAYSVEDDPSYAGPPPVRQILRVIVPDGARSGWLYVTVNVGGNGGVSNSVFFQTRFVVNFDLIASVSPQVNHRYTYELDFQGDGIYDVLIDTSSTGTNPRQMRHENNLSLQHDYASDGFGNYQATLKVTDTTSGRVEIGHQLIQVRNLRPVMTSSSNAPEAFGLITSLIPSIVERYPIPGSGLTVRTSTGGMSSLSGIRYKWNIDGNARGSSVRATYPSPANPGRTLNVNLFATVSADATFASIGIPIKYFANLRFNFTTTDTDIFNITLDEDESQTILEWDFNGDTTPDYISSAGAITASTYTALAKAMATADQTIFNTIGDYTGFLRVSTRAIVTDNNNNQYPVAITFATPLNLPTVTISNVLNTLYLPSLGNDTDHLISVTAVAEEIDSATGVTRFISATDTIHIPSANNPLNNVFAYSGTEPPYSIGNTASTINYTLIGIYGSGAPLNFWADINTDGYFEIGQINYFNPQSVSRVTAQNDINRLNPGATNSFPTELPGVNFTLISVQTPIVAAKGVYTSYALIKDAGGVGSVGGRSRTQTYAFETQEIFVGGGRSGGGGALRLAVDIFLNPLVGTTTQAVDFQSFVSGGTLPYSYQWTIRRVDTGTIINFENPTQANIPNPVFVAATDAIDESTSVGFPLEGDYEVQLTVFDAFGAVAGSKRVILTLKSVALSAQLMAVPPSATVDEPVNYIVYIDGGQPPYQVTISYDDPNDARVDTVTTWGSYAFFSHVYDAVWLDRSTPANGRYDDPEDGVDPYIIVTDSSTPPQRVVGIEGDPDFSINAVQKVLVGERLPLNITLVAAPTSGNDNFDIQVNYSVAGGRKFSSGSLGQLGGFGAGRNRFSLGSEDDYFVTVALIEAGGSTPSGGFRQSGFGGLFGAGFGRFSDVTFRTQATTIINPLGDDGIFMNGDSGEVYDPIYFHIPQPGNYIVMAFVSDGAGEWAVDQTRIYSEGYLSPAPTSTTKAPKVRVDGDGRPLHAVRIWTDPLYVDSRGGDYNSNDYRLREADIQVFGDLLTVDPSPNFLSPAMFAAKDPSDASPYSMSYLLNPEDPTPVDFYDTFTIGRVNINTASEEVLAAVFGKIIKRRGYYEEDDTAQDPPRWKRGDRNYSEDVYLSREEARALARAVVEYRNAYYDAYKPRVSGGGFFYGHGTSNNPYQSGDIRVDHLPVIGPWDGVNPKVYDVNSRDAELPDYRDITVINTWDNYRGNYYNLESTTGSFPLKFYAPSDIAVVRAQRPGESDEAYAKYLNDTLANNTELTDPLGIDTTAGFDARHYFVYDTSQGEDRSDARNRIAIINSNGESGYTFIPNPPFQSIFDLYKVVGVSDPDLYALVDPNPRSFDLYQNGDGIKFDPTTFFTVNERTLSGPSLFRYSEIWDWRENRFLPTANYLDDIAPYITTRTYMYRILGIGGVDISGLTENNPVTLDRIDRDMSKEIIIDAGNMRLPSESSIFGTTIRSGGPYTVVYEERSSGALE